MDTTADLSTRNVTLNSDLLTGYVEQMYRLRQSYIDKCQYASELWQQTSQLNDKSNICDIFQDHKDQAYEYYEIHIGTSDMYYRQVEEVEVDTPDKLLIDILGSLGFFLGFSFVTFVEFFIFFYTILVKIFQMEKN